MRHIALYFLVLIFSVGVVLADDGERLEMTGSSKRAPKWQQRKVVFSISDSLRQSSLTDLSERELATLIEASFEKWAGESGVRFDFVTTAVENVSSRSSGGDGISLITAAPTSENLLLFGERKTSLSAITRVFLDSSGYIVEADIVLNPTARFTTDGSRGTFDFESTMTHEAGHSLGLPHSGVLGSTMHRHQGRNGIFGLPSTYPRTISAVDKNKVRSVYRQHEKSFCNCGAVAGDLSEAATGLGKGTFVWAESTPDGLVAASAELDATGKFLIEFLEEGEYQIYGSSADGTRIFELYDPVYVESGGSETLTYRDFSEGSGGNLLSFGFNGQISSLAIPVERGHRFLISVAVKDIDISGLSVSAMSPGLLVSDSTVALQYKKGDVSVVSFELVVGESIKNGDYSLQISYLGEVIGYAPGVVTVDHARNPWYSAIFQN